MWEQSVTGTGRNDMERRRAMRRMTGKQKKPIISGNLGAAARDPRDRGRERERDRRSGATSSRDRTNGRRAPQQRDATHRARDATRAIANNCATIHRRASWRDCSHPDSPFSPLVLGSVGATCRHDRAPDYMHSRLIYYNYNEYSTFVRGVCD